MNDPAVVGERGSVPPAQGSFGAQVGLQGKLGELYQHGTAGAFLQL